MATATITITLCVGCQTPVRPNKLRCDRCYPRHMDELLDSRLASGQADKASTLALSIASRNFRMTP